MLDTVECAMSLPAEKLKTLHEFLLEFSVCRRASKRQLQVLAGKLNWACRVVYGGRTFLRQVIDQICLLKSPNAKFRLDSEFFADLRWWISFLSSFNGRQVFLDKVPTIDVQADTCSIGAGAFFRGDWLYHLFILMCLKFLCCISIVRKYWPFILLLNSGLPLGQVIILSYILTIWLQLLLLIKALVRIRLLWLSSGIYFGLQLFAILELQLSTFQGIRILLRILFHVCMMDFI